MTAKMMRETYFSIFHRGEEDIRFLTEIFAGTKEVLCSDFCFQIYWRYSYILGYCRRIYFSVVSFSYIYFWTVGYEKEKL